MSTNGSNDGIRYHYIEGQQQALLRDVTAMQAKVDGQNEFIREIRSMAQEALIKLNELSNMMRIMQESLFPPPAEAKPKRRRAK